jgi:branched-chain amino acid transport system permease protein
MNRRRLWLGLIIGVAGLALFTLPWWSPPLYLTLSIRIMFFGLLAISLSFLAGQLNKISLTQTAFFGVAAYSIAILGVKHNIPFPYPALVGLGLAILLAALFGLVATRSSGIYFIMITLALGQLTWALSNQWLSMTGGYDGIPGIRAPTVWGIPFVNPKNFYFALLVVFLICVGAVALIIRSSFGLTLRGIRESPTRMAALGYPVFWIEYLAFIISGTLAGISGIFFAYFTWVVNPHALDLSRAVWILLVSILGGVGSLFGPLLGTTIVVLAEIKLSQLTERYMTIIGLIFILVVLFAPEGITGRLRGWKPSFRSLVGKQPVNPPQTRGAGASNANLQGSSDRRTN